MAIHIVKRLLLFVITRTI